MNTATKEAILRELKGAEDISAKAETDNRALTGEEQAQVMAHFTTAKELKARAQGADDMREQIGSLSKELGLETRDKGRGDGHLAEEAAKRGGLHVPKRGESLGKAFTDSAAYRDMLASVPDGRFGEKSRVHSNPFGVKTLLTGSDRQSAGGLVDSERYGMLDPFYQRPLTVRQLVTNGQTASDTIEFVRLQSVENQARSVAEAQSAAPIAGAVTPAVGGVKPESGMTFQRDQTTVKTIAHWLPATKRSLSDAAQVRTLVDAFLLYGLEEELERQIMAGDGTGEELTGIDATSGVQTQDGPEADVEKVFDVLRKARTKVQIGGRSNPTAYVLNPIDWEAIELSRDGTDRYYGAGPFAMTPSGLWGLPVVQSEAVPVGTGYCADWTKAVLWDREQAAIQATDSHSDFFVRNLVAILAELRCGFAVLRPSAFVKVTLTEAGGA